MMLEEKLSQEQSLRNSSLSQPLNPLKRDAPFSIRLEPTQALKWVETLLLEGGKEKLFKAIAEAIPIPLAMCHLYEGRIIYANRHFHHVFGLVEHHPNNRSLVDFWFNLSDYQNLLDQLRQDGSVHNTEVAVKKADGSCFWVMASLQRLRFKGDAVIVGIFYDISDRKQAEIALQESKERLYRQHLALRDLSQAQTLSGNNLHTAIRQISKTAANTLEVERVSLWLNENNPEMSEHWLYMPKLAANLAHFENEPHSSKILNLKWICLDGYDRNCDRHWAELTATPSDASAYHQAFLTQQFIQQSGLSFNPDQMSASEFEGSVRLSVPIWLGGKIIGYICVESSNLQRSWTLEERTFVDSLANLVALTIERFEHQKAQEALSKVKAELEVRVEKRTTELRQAVQQLRDEMVERLKIESALQEALGRAEAASRAKSTFLANMSHELRTPLHAIIGYSDLLQEEALEQGFVDGLEDLKRVRQAGLQLLHVIDDILSLSKIEAGQMKLDLETFDLAALIHEVVTHLQPLAQKNRNRLDICCKSNLGLMHADLTKVQQILHNLLSNGLKFTEDGSVTLTVTRELNPDCGWICFCVQDTGIGISLEQQQRLFQAFSQGDSSLARKYGGTGLGLAISHHFCKMMGGHIQVVSQLGRGSTFRVYLPADVEA